MTDQSTEKPKFLPAGPLSEAGIKKILVAMAHHDDIEFGVGASIAKWVSEGAVVTYVIITDGGAGSNTPGVVRSDLVAQRKEEQIKAAAAVGVTDVRFLGYEDGVLQPTIELRRDIVRIIREVKPDRVVLQDPTTVFFGDNYINHPDHRAAGEAVLYSVFPSSETRPIFAELLEEGLEPHKVKDLFVTLSLNPTHYVDTTDFVEHKVAALRHHVSQLGDEKTAEENALKWTRERSAESGKLVGVGAAEFFKVMVLNRPAAPHDKKEDTTQETVEEVQQQS
jgi:LmbE family N-acetylglucosaminyl deacetylase